MRTKTFNTNLPSIALEGSLGKYLAQIKKFPILSAEEEYVLGKSWRDGGDLKSAQKLVTSALVPFKKPEDLVLVWQYGKDIGLSFSQAISELYPIPGSGGTRVCAGVHIHEGILLAGDVQYQIIEDAVEVQHYKIKGLGTVILSMKEVQSKINRLFLCTYTGYRYY